VLSKSHWHYSKHLQSAIVCQIPVLSNKKRIETDLELLQHKNYMVQDIPKVQLNKGL
jgi:hypothetical protein